MGITTRELRNLLFEVENQDTTIAELRRRLFEMDEQDEQISIENLRKI